MSKVENIILLISLIFFNFRELVFYIECNISINIHGKIMFLAKYFYAQIQMASTCTTSSTILVILKYSSTLIHEIITDAK